MTVSVKTSRRNMSVQHGRASFVSLDFGGTPQPLAQASPRISVARQRMGEMASIDAHGLTIESVEWFNDGVSFSTGPTVMLPMMGKITAEVLVAGSSHTTPQINVLHAHSDPTHNTTDDAVLALCRHADATHIAVASGSWSDPLTWDVGVVPQDGARALIPVGHDVTYDAAIAPRLDRVRVDGTLRWALDRSTTMLVETLFDTPGGKIIMGDAVGNRLPPEFTANITISNRAYRLNAEAPTDLDLENDPKLIGRGILALGEWTAFAAVITPYEKTVPLGLPLSGDTGVVLQRAPVGWSVGDRIVIPGTKVDEVDGVTTRYDEERIITAVNENVVLWDEPLVYDHDTQSTLSSITSRAECQLPIINTKRNITVQSEAGALVHQRGHTMAMHGLSMLDLWGVAFLDMGRTDKSKPAGFIDADGNFEFPISTGTDSGEITTAPLTAQSNLQSRYAIHGHIMGFKRAVIPLVRDCYTEGNKGWANVHHGCEMNWLNNVIYRFQGAGLVGESGDEQGRWDRNVVIGLESVNASTKVPKIEESDVGLIGDVFKNGLNFAYRGRAMIVTRNIAIGGMWGHSFYHRGGGVSPKSPIVRKNVDVNDLNLINGSDLIEVPDYPIAHFDRNASIGCYGGGSVVKNDPAQGHDLNIKLTNHLTWACATGFHVEYIGSYALIGFLCLSASQSKISTWRFTSDSNHGLRGVRADQVAWDDFEVIGFRKGICLGSTSPTGTPDSAFSQGDPKFIIGSGAFTDCEIDIDYETQSVSDATRVMSLPITYLDRPAINLPFMTGEMNFPTSTYTMLTTGTKTDSVSSAGALPKVWEGAGLDFSPFSVRGSLDDYAERYGVWDYDTGTSIEKVIVYPTYWSDRLTGMNVKTMQAIVFPNYGRSFPENGAFTFSNSPPICADVTRNVAVGIEDSFNVLDNATGDIGTTLSLNVPELSGGIGTTEPAHFKANYGAITLSSSGVVTYTAHPETGGITDKMLVYIYDGKGRFCTVEITFNIAAT